MNKNVNVHCAGIVRSVVMNTPSTKRRGSMVGSTSSTNSVSVPVSADLASLFECPVCFDYVLPPILQCQSGHLVCSSCRPKLTCCPTCRGPLGKYNMIICRKLFQIKSSLCFITINSIYK